MSLKFEWDRKKAESNLSKHRVSFQEALKVFGDPLARIFSARKTTRRERKDYEENAKA